MEEITGPPLAHYGESKLDEGLRWKSISNEIVTFYVSGQGTRATIDGEPAILPTAIEHITLWNKLYGVARRKQIQTSRTDSGWVIHFVGPEYVLTHRPQDEKFPPPTAALLTKPPEAHVCGTLLCGADACGALVCGGLGCASDACGGLACAAQASTGGVCGAQVCSADACAGVACPANACGANACVGDLGLLPCGVEACVAHLGIPECPFIL